MLFRSPLIKQTNIEGKHQINYDNPMLELCNPYTAEIRSFIFAVENNKAVEVTGEQALKALKVALAALESSKTGQPVELN